MSLLWGSSIDKRNRLPVFDTWAGGEEEEEHMKINYTIPGAAGQECEIEERYPGEPESVYPLDQIPVAPTAPVKREDSNEDSATLMYWYLPNVEALDAWAETEEWNQHIIGIIISEE